MMDVVGCFERGEAGHRDQGIQHKDEGQEEGEEDLQNDQYSCGKMDQF